MCLAVVISKGSKLSEEYARNGFSRNSQGAGFAYIDEGKLKIEKGFFSFEDFWKEFSEIQSKFEGPFLVHFRIATCGKVGEYNCHPWRIDDNHALIHNGSLSSFSKDCGRISDTGLFVETVIQPLFKSTNKEFLGKYFFVWLMQKVITYNKVAILKSNGAFTIYNKSSWIEENGIWFSNGSYKETVKKNFTSGYRGRQHSKKRKRNPRYRLAGETKELSDTEISQITHLHKKKIKHLLRKGVVEKFYKEPVNSYDYEQNGQPFNKKDKTYIDWWMGQCRPELLFLRE